MLEDFIKIKNWTKVWSGRWSLHFDSHIANDWTKNIKVVGKPVFKHVIYVYKDGITDCWVSQAEKDYLGKRFCLATAGDSKYVINLTKQFKILADEVTIYLKKHQAEKMSDQDLEKFWELIGRYYLPHLSVKYMVDYLSPKQLKKYLPILEESRLYAEPIFRNTEDFFEKIAQDIARKNKYKKEMLLATTAKELEDYFRTSILPNKKVLERRFKKSILIAESGTQKVISNKGFVRIEKLLDASSLSDKIIGQTAYNGKVVGVARIVINPKEYNSIFNNGDILITGMTRPEFLPLIKKSGAFVTDAGGILSHAAITARELKKPCIIGTKIATKIFKAGDIVEVDANNGIIKKLK